MGLKRYISVLLIATIFFIVGMAVGRFVMPRKIYITMVDIKELVEIIERYNERNRELERIKEWNENAVMDPPPEEEKK